jgi:hypothetical protein
VPRGREQRYIAGIRKDGCHNDRMEMTIQIVFAFDAPLNCKWDTRQKLSFGISFITSAANSRQVRLPECGPQPELAKFPHSDNPVSQDLEHLPFCNNWARLDVMFSSTMLLPLMAFEWGFLAFTIVGLITLALVPGLRLTVPNLFLFVAGAFPGAFVVFLAYGSMFGKNEWSDVASKGIFPVLLVGGALGGTLLVWLKTRFVRTRRDQVP